MRDQFKYPPKPTGVSTERQKVDFETMRPKIIEPSDETWRRGKTYETYTGKPRRLFVEHIRRKYKDKYYIPGLEYGSYLLSLPPEKVPEKLKGGTSNYLIGFSSNDIEVHILFWDGNKFIIKKLPLEGKIGASEAVVLLEKK